MKQRTQNQGLDRVRKCKTDSKKYLVYPSGKSRKLFTIWKASKPHDQVIDFSLAGPNV